ncbi:hypothetical protein [Actinocrispum sp. NPDC049592]|uniref:hypothetical protein n=1 Tax=Actinocrispum sp. NPDC049592 TaxID=3154835 RepID=UPI003447C519
MQDVDTLIEELNARMSRDCRWLSRWRQFHRLTAIILNVVLIVAPPILAVGLVDAGSPLGKLLLLAVTVVGGVSATFKPYTHSYRRRADMNSLYRLRDEFRGETAAVSAEDVVAKTAVFLKYSSIYSNIYELRGRELIEATLSVTEEREIAGKKTLQTDGEQPR